MLAQVNLSPQGQWTNLGGLTIPGIIAGFITAVLIIAAVVFFFILVIGGIRWITSGGDKANTEAASGQIAAPSVIPGVVVLTPPSSLKRSKSTSRNILQNLT